MAGEFDRIQSVLTTLLQQPLESCGAAERLLVDDILAAIRRGDELSERLQRLERENLELTATNRMLAEVSARDSLTGLYNRWYVLDKLEAEINRSLRHGSPMAVLMVDLDHFKQVNDTYGHTAGDQVLQSVGKLLLESCRVYDVPGRYGGEEFCVLLPQIALGSTPGVAERIRHRLETTQVMVGDSSLMVTASIGIAGIDSTSGEPLLSATALIDRADRALYSAKNHGRNRVEVWDAGLRDSRAIEPTGH